METGPLPLKPVRSLGRDLDLPSAGWQGGPVTGDGQVASAQGGSRGTLCFNEPLVTLALCSHPVSVLILPQGLRTQQTVVSTHRGACWGLATPGSRGSGCDWL